MDAMTILRRCRESDEDIRRLEQRIAQRRMAMDSLQAPQMDPNGGSRGSGDPDKTGRMVAELDLLERDRDRRNEERNAEIASACALLDMVPELESRVLYAYYVEPTPLGMHRTTGDIARREKYTAAYLRKVKRRAEMLLGMLSAERVAGTLPGWYLKSENERKQRRKG